MNITKNMALGMLAGLILTTVACGGGGSTPDVTEDAVQADAPAVEEVAIVPEETKEAEATPAPEEPAEVAVVPDSQTDAIPGLHAEIGSHLSDSYYEMAGPTLHAEFGNQGYLKDTLVEKKAEYVITAQPSKNYEKYINPND